MKQLYILILFVTLPSLAQESIHLKECHNLIAKNYPLAKQNKLLASQNKLELAVINTIKLPKFNLDAQATYQSDVIKIPTPNLPVNSQNKDQYRATVSVHQLIYNGGVTKATLNLKTAELKSKQKQIEVTLYKLKEEVNELYFSILLSEEKNKLLEEKKRYLEAKLREVESAVKHGVLLPSTVNVLQTELLKIAQQFITIKSNKLELIETLSSLIGKKLTKTTLFTVPLFEVELDSIISRPELALFKLKKAEIDKSITLISKQNTPKINGFATGGYGNPGLNMLDNSFQTFYTLGVKLHWNFFDWNSTKKQRELTAINNDIITNQAEIFKLNTRIKLNKYQKKIDEIKELISSDITIIKLRKDVLKAASIQLENGVITASAYITELVNLFEDESNFIKHKIELQLAKANYNIIKGE
ncbi:TolC family protein [Tenacibaculum aestuariivivum]|uniref:TolC family protein n=1 Tax=Tenacibaculum aestuariivivum TaxID=2006131 RepID=UPI003AB5AB46